MSVSGDLEKCSKIRQIESTRKTFRECYQEAVTDSRYIQPWEAQACTNPIKAYKAKHGLIFSEQQAREAGLSLNPIGVKCTKCITCRINHAREWAIRIYHESCTNQVVSDSLGGYIKGGSIFLTLTYNDQSLPSDNGLHYRHIQSFLKRLRKAIEPQRFRFYCAGEYGSPQHTTRPHWHLILFGINFNQTRRFLKKNKNDITYYIDPIIKDAWGKGNHDFSDYTFGAGNYVAQYVTKKITGELADEHYRRTNKDTGETWNVEPELQRSSTRPGLGFDWWQANKEECKLNDHVKFNDKKYPIPQYYNRLWKSEVTEQEWNAICDKRLEAHLQRKAELQAENPKRFEKDIYYEQRKTKTLVKRRSINQREEC